jgi:predicted RNase H-like HicB family nuclease
MGLTPFDINISALGRVLFVDAVSVFTGLIDNFYISSSLISYWLIIRVSMKPLFTALIQREDDMFVSFCPELDIASQGFTVEESRMNLKEAIELFLETASPAEISQRTKNEVYITSLEVEIA